MHKGDIGVVTVVCGYCDTILRNVGSRVAFNHVHSCARELDDNVVQVGDVQAKVLERKTINLIKFDCLGQKFGQDKYFIVETIYFIP